MSALRETIIIELTMGGLKTSIVSLVQDIVMVSPGTRIVRKTHWNTLPAGLIFTEHRRIVGNVSVFKFYLLIIDLLWLVGFVAEGNGQFGTSAQDIQIDNTMGTIAKAFIISSFPPQ